MADAHYPDDLRYHREHDWVRMDGDDAVFGITSFAQEALGEVVFFDPPAVGDTVEAGVAYGELESVKAVSDVYAPAGGEVLVVNEAVVANPGLVNTDPYGEGWLLRVRLSDPAELEELLSATRYTEYLAELG